MNIKNRLMDLRLERKFRRQKEFAAYLGLSETYYNKLENNKCIMTIETLFKIARKLNVDINEIVYYCEENS